MAEQNQIVKYVVDFAQDPGPRYREQGADSGEKFYEEALSLWFTDALSQNKQLVVVLDGTNGYLSSFLDESFGRLVYYNGIDKVKKNLKVVSTVEPEWLKLIDDKSKIWEERRKTKEAPKTTANAH